MFFCLGGIGHFVKTDFYLKIMPPYIPYHRLMVYLSGIAEFVLGVGLLVPNYSKFAAWGLVALLIAVFPANIYMATHPELFSEIPRWALWGRLPLQLVFILWIYFASRTVT